MIKLKNLLAESMRRFKTKNLNEDDKSKMDALRKKYPNSFRTDNPQDNIIKIDGSEPYVTVSYNDNGQTVAIDFEEYDFTDRIDDYAWDVYIIGTDNKGQEWTVSAQAVDLGGGDYDWEIDWDTLEKQR